MNNEKVKRPFLLTGLIITLICFIALAVTSVVGIYATLLADGLSNLGKEDAILDLTIAILGISFGLVLVFSILGIVFASISMSRTRLSPQEFDNKRGMITTTIVFAIIVAVLEIIGLFSEFNVVNLIFSLALILAIVFMFIDRNKNNKLLEISRAQENQQSDSNLDNQNKF